MDDREDRERSCLNNESAEWTTAQVGECERWFWLSVSDSLKHLGTAEREVEKDVSSPPRINK